MDEKERIELVRSILNNAAKINAGRGTLLQISQKLDKYIIAYYRKNKSKKRDTFQK